MTQKVFFRTATVTLTPETIEAEFNDGKVNIFHYGGKDESYKDVVELYGYGTDWRAYALQHELAHHFIADNLAWKWSWSLHSTAGKEFVQSNAAWPNHIEWEENLVNAFQQFMREGVKDQWNTLHMVFPPLKLESLANSFRNIIYFVEKGYDSVKYIAEINGISVNEPVLPR